MSFSYIYQILAPIDLGGVPTINGIYIDNDEK